MQCTLDAKFSEKPTVLRTLRQDLRGLGRSAEAGRGRTGSRKRGPSTTTLKGGGGMSPAAMAGAGRSPSARRLARGPPSSFGGLPILSPMARLAPGWSQAVSEQPGVKIGYIRLNESGTDLLLSCDSVSIRLQVPLILLLRLQRLPRQNFCPDLDYRRAFPDSRHGTPPHWPAPRHAPWRGWPGTRPGSTF